MEILLVENIDPYKTPTGGIGIYLKNLTAFLKKEGIPTLLLGAGTPPQPNDPAVGLKIEVDRFIPITPQKGSHPAYTLNLLKQLPSLSIPVDAVIHGQRSDVMAPFFFRNIKRPMLCSLHAVHGKAVGRKRGRLSAWTFAQLEKYTLRRVPQIAAVGETVARYFSEKYPWCADRMSVIPVGVDLERFKPVSKKTARETFGFGADEKIMLYVGRLEIEKNIDLLIDALALVLKEEPAARLVIAGTGRMEESLKAHARETSEKQIRFLGHTENIPLLMNCADVFTLASHYEGGPIVVKEALACNVPVTATDVGEVRRVMGDISGCYIATPEADAFAAAVLKVFRADEPCRARAQMVDHGIEQTFKKTLELYKRLTSE